jgi:Protein of unknown function (DUF3810)
VPEPVRGWLAATLLALVLAFAPVPAWLVDQFYSRDMYPFVQRWMTGFSNLFPIAVLDVLLVAMFVGVLYRVRRLFVVLQQRGVIDAAWEGFRRLIRVAAVVVILFLWTWGCNYRRIPLETSMGVIERPTVGSLQAAIADSSALAGRLRPVTEGPADIGFDQIAATLGGPFDAAVKALGLQPLARKSRPKYSLILTPFFTASGTDGMTDPLALETIVNPSLLPSERPFVLAHEWAHLAGQADEAEASAVGWLACMFGPPPLAYSGHLYLIMEGLSSLSPAQRRIAMTRLDPAVRGDIELVIERTRMQNPTVQRTASRVYDQYLRANRVQDGNASYGRALTIILSPQMHDVINRHRERERRGGDAPMP